MKIYLGFGRHDIAHEAKFFFFGVGFLCFAVGVFTPVSRYFFPLRFLLPPALPGGDILGPGGDILGA